MDCRDVDFWEGFIVDTEYLQPKKRDSETSSE